jgi:hypothetical protein
MPSSACIKPDDDAANSVAAGTNMMQQAQPKSAAARADATTRPLVELAYSRGWNNALPVSTPACRCAMFKKPFPTPTREPS